MQKIQLIKLGIVLSLLTVDLQLAKAALKQADRADVFVDKMGVNTRFRFTNTTYGIQYSTIKSKLGELGIRYCRDALSEDSSANRTARTRMLELYNDFGIQFALTMGNRDSNNELIRDTTSIDQQVEFIKKGGGSSTNTSFVHALIGPNEYNGTRRTNWHAELRTYMERLDANLSSDSSLSNRFVIAPPVIFGDRDGDGTEDVLELGDLSDWVDYGNMHLYNGALKPSQTLSGSIVFADNTVNGGRIWATEFGYHNAIFSTVNGNFPINYYSEAKYLPRFYAEFWLENKKGNFGKAFSYDFADRSRSLSEKEDRFGLLSVNTNGSMKEKPVYRALRGLISKLKDAKWNTSSKKWDRPEFDPAKLDYSVSSQLSDTKTALFQKRNGNFILMFWREINSFNRDTNQDGAFTGSSIDSGNDGLPANDQTDGITLTVNTPISQMTAYKYNSSFNYYSTGTTTGQSRSLQVPDNLMLVEVKPYLRLKSKRSGKCWGVEDPKLNNGSQIQQYTCNTGNSQTDPQRWRFVYQTSAGGNLWYRIENLKSGKCVRPKSGSSGNGIVLEQYTCGTQDGQHWRFDDQGDGYFRIVNRRSGRCIGIRDPKTSNGSKLQQFDCGSGSSQRWKFFEQ